MAETKVLLVARVDPALQAEVEALASAELDGNTSMMVRRLLREALDARSAGSRPVGPAEAGAQTLSAAKVTRAVQPDRIARKPVAPVFSEAGPTAAERNAALMDEARKEVAGGYDVKKQSLRRR